MKMLCLDLKLLLVDDILKSNKILQLCLTVGISFQKIELFEEETCEITYKESMH